MKNKLPDILPSGIIEMAPKPVKKEMSKTEMEKWIAREQERDNEMVVGLFEYKERKGKKLKFFRKIYPNEDIQMWEFEDGQVYRIPYGVAKHLATGIFTPIYQKLPKAYGELGKAIGSGRLAGDKQMALMKKSYRTDFKSLQFREDDWETKQSELVEVKLGK